MTIDTDILKRSVTAGDHSDNPYSSPGFFYFAFPGAVTRRGSDLPGWWSRERDYHLRSTVHMESMWGSAVAKAITKQCALGWTIKDEQDGKTRIRRSQDLLNLADGGLGWVHFFSKIMQDFLLTDNGAFIEVVRASRAPGSRIIGIMHLDSCRCVRTADPDIPVLYRDRKGREHEMRAHQVLTMADMPSAGETYNGVGMCAASRAYLTISKLSKMEQYVDEKIGGDGATELAVLQGLSGDQLAGALSTAKADKDRKGSVQYMGKIVITTLGDTPLNLVTIPLKSVPDGFESKEERNNAYLIYAAAIGVPLQVIQPLSGQGLGTGKQSEIQNDEGEEMGLVAGLKQFAHLFNTFVFPAATTFSFSDTNDTRKQKAKAEVSKLRAETRATQTQSGEINPAMSRQLALDAGDLPPELVPEDETLGGQVNDDEKVPEPTQPSELAQTAPIEAPQKQPLAAPGQQRPQPPQQAEKAARDLDALITDELTAALEWARRAA